MSPEVAYPVQNRWCVARELSALKGRTTWKELTDCAEQFESMRPSTWLEVSWQHIMGRNPPAPGAPPPGSHPGVTGPWQALAVILLVAHCCGALTADFDRMLAHVEEALRCWMGRVRRPNAAGADDASDMVDRVRPGLQSKHTSNASMREYIEEVWATGYA